MWPPMTNHDRRTDDGNRDRLDRIHKSYVRFSRRIAIAMTIQGVGLILSLVVVGYGIRENHDTIKEVKKIAVTADIRSERNRVRQLLAKEKVCSQSSNRRVACRALFERLSGSISNRQRYLLACSVLEKMRGPIARDLRRETKCNAEGGP